ncbi:MAG TPA: hypothetical protein VJ982_06505 [Gemmatimonadota bacterium]|nr:hypothetical protein [Gemmatimonadota bacterium]
MSVTRFAIVIAGLAVAAACASYPDIEPWEYEPRPMADTLAIVEPSETSESLIYNQVHGFGEAVARGFNLKRRASGPPQAWNPDAFDEVVNSTWFTNRNARRALTPEQIRRGPQTGTGPVAPLTVTSIKSEGVSPGFNATDAEGQRWIFKFDPPDYNEMASGAEVVATNLFWAAGYYTPENYVHYFDPAELVLEDDPEDPLVASFVEDSLVVTYSTNPGEGERELTLDVFRSHVLDRYPTTTEGRVRALASKFLEGVPKGPFEYIGVRPDDPNDVIPHEHRRELRGLYAMAAWLNHTDVKAGNSLDMFIVSRESRDEDESQIGYLRHNLIDFGSTLGSSAVRPRTARHGNEYQFDAGAILLRTLTLGAYERPWQDIEEGDYPSAVGYYSIDNYFPEDWRSNSVNPALINRTARDGYWGAKLVMSFTDAQLDAAVAAGQYSDPAAVSYLLRGLKERRDATGRYWFRRVSPLDAPRIESGALVFDDLWIRHFGGPAGYRWQFDYDPTDPDIEVGGTAVQPSIPLPAPVGPLDADPDDDERYAEIEIWKVFGDGEEAPSPATFWLDWNPDSRTWRVVGARY